MAVDFNKDSYKNAVNTACGGVKISYKQGEVGYTLADVVKSVLTKEKPLNAFDESIDKSALKSDANFECLKQGARNYLMSEFPESKPKLPDDTTIPGAGNGAGGAESTGGQGTGGAGQGAAGPGDADKVGKGQGTGGPGTTPADAKVDAAGFFQRAYEVLSQKEVLIGLGIGAVALTAYAVYSNHLKTEEENKRLAEFAAEDRRQEIVNAKYDVSSLELKIRRLSEKKKKSPGDQQALSSLSNELRLARCRLDALQQDGMRSQ